MAPNPASAMQTACTSKSERKTGSKGAWAKMSELKLITPRRNFLMRALGFTAAGATLPIGIVAADVPKARIEHHRAELEKAWRDYYGSEAVRSYIDVRPCRATYTSHGR